MDGILIIDKPAGITSHDVVARCRRILRTKRIGHTGTLDPFATGVMVILVGRATRLARFLERDAKEYEAVVRLGFETDTGDKTGELRITNYELRSVTDEEIEIVLKDFRGEIRQTPPMFSAKKIAGKKLYELARQGIEIEREAIKINVYELERLNSTSDFKPEIGSRKPETAFSDFKLRVSCSAGTYIRTLAEDIGKRLETGAHLAALRRTRAGKFDVKNSATLEKLEEIVAADKLDGVLVSMNQAVSHLPEIKLSNEDAAKIKNGVRLTVDLTMLADKDFVRLIENENLVAVAVYEKSEKTIRPKVVLL
ncbi:MAG: tRNA pseudouridine(55) synthase TruB [Acidobacteria bacterium]|jgi:tRNA pseudouridine55 synthase|nr:tRNA pseudouridine(55) synthase TruB [Acidobacteriota bacterium]